MNIRINILIILICSLLSQCNKEEALFNTDSSENITLAAIAEPYKDLLLIDIHNHDAAGYKYQQSVAVWDQYAINRIVLFGNISEPSAKETDEIAFKVYEQNKERFYPFIAGIDIHSESCLTYIRNRFEAGVFGIGEVVGASIYSPVASQLPWKGEHPLDGYFPEIYELCAEYNKPILLHLDPPNGQPVSKLLEAAELYPNTNFIFAHANAYNSPAGIRSVLENSTNIYIDFMPGFTAYNTDSSYDLDDFLEVILDFPERFFVSSDGGYGIGYDNAYTAIYELFDLIDDKETINKLAHENFLSLIN